MNLVEEHYMNRALELAQKGCGFVNPNPMVGAVIVKEEKVIGEGYHESYGKEHAEVNAFKNCKSSAEGATLYVTLEPCCHYGKTPPCTEEIIRQKIAHVVVGTLDPNPLVRGKGVKRLQDAGINVTVGVLEPACKEQNKVFLHFIENQTPYVTMKYAVTADGKLATYTNQSKWITGEVAREHVHGLRHAHSGIMVGVNTVKVDNPLLNCRLEGGKHPKRIICDTHLSIPIDSQIVQTAKDIPTYIATALAEDAYDKEKEKLLTFMGCKILHLPQKDKYIDLKTLMIELGEEKIDSILLEGGARLNFSALQAGIVKELKMYIAPKLFGGMAKTPIEGQGVADPNDAYQLIQKKVLNLGKDLLIEYEVR
jgi:diaminohydroxyphosphoribosylaminopyrimidine deaminase/5-amino-6-(5-phosphoribosylamino)uracil reductase